MRFYRSSDERSHLTSKCEQNLKISAFNLKIITLGIALLYYDDIMNIVNTM